MQQRERLRNWTRTLSEQSKDTKAAATGKLTVVERSAPEAPKPDPSKAEGAKPEAPKPRPVAAGPAADASRPSEARLVEPGPQAPKPAAGKVAAKADARPANPKPRPAPAATVPAMQRSLAEPAQPRRRHMALAVSFAVAVIAPILVASWYLWTRAADQYASYLGFTVRTQELSSPVDILSGLTGISGGGNSDLDILYEFIRSRELVSRIDAKVDLQAMFSRETARDPVFGFTPGQPIETLLDYWRRMVRVDFNATSRLMAVQVAAFAPEDAQVIAREILDESSRVINDLSDVAREDTTRYAREDLDVAVERLKAAREAVTAFRSRYQIADLQSDIQTQMGLISTLQKQLADALIEFDLLKETTRAADPRLEQVQRRIAVTQSRIAQERGKFAAPEPGGDGAGTGAGQPSGQAEASDAAPDPAADPGAGDGGVGEGEGYATLIGESERLNVDRQFAEQTYVAALASYDKVRAEALRKSRYLAAYVEPTLAQSAEYPRRWMLLGVVALFCLMGWSILSLIYYSLRDRH